jgi:glycosyltransferase involved in cell wall biosynthesis
MRILMAAHTFLPESQGGMENHAHHLAHYLLSRGHQVGMFYRFRDRTLPEYQLFEGEWEGIQTYRFVRNYTNPLPTPYRFYDRQVEMLFERILDTFRPDVVHIHHLADLTTTLPAVARRRGIPSIITLHDYWPMCFMSHLRTPDGIVCNGPDEGLRCVECLWKKKLEEYAPVNIRARFRELGLLESIRRAPRFAADWLFARLAAGSSDTYHANLKTEMIALAVRNDHMLGTHQTADLLISPSRFLIAKFVEWGLPASHFRHVYNSVQASLREIRPEKKPPGERIVFGFMGTLYPPKGAHVLVDAFRRLASEQAELRLWGAAPNATQQAYADELYRQGEKVPNLHFQGPFSPERLPEVLNQIDVLVVPSVWFENNPLVILEAHAAGIPVLAGNAGGMAELVDHDINGLLFCMGDAQDLADKMRLMLERDRLERYQATITPPWSHEEMGAEVERIYQRLIEGDPIS